MDTAPFPGKGDLFRRCPLQQLSGTAGGTGQFWLTLQRSP